jgi:hypothetical protein
VKPAKGFSFTVRPSAAIRAKFQRRLDAELDDMHASLVFWLVACYRANTPEIAQDASPARELMDEMRGLRTRWMRRFNALAPKMARYFATATAKRTDKAMADMLRKGGISVRFDPTRVQNDVVQAAIAENVSLIKSIASEHLTQVEGMVMRSVTAGRDLASLHTELRERLGVTKRRASLIARQQNNAATAALVKVRQIELDLEAEWLHSAGGKTPRPSHVRQSGKLYDPRTGWFDPDAKVWTWPGVLINCRCVSKTVVPGFD